MAQPRHDGVGNLLTSLIVKVCTNVEVEPQLQPLSIMSDSTSEPR